MDQSKYISPFEKDNNYSASYQEVLNFFDVLSEQEDFIQMNPFGLTDTGKPLHEIVLDLDQDFDPIVSRAKNKSILFINNAIHPGEPCGIDASMMLVRDFAEGKLNKDWLKELVIVIIPVYNIGGALNRGSFSRANQDGPHQYGFRGNTKNLDLNRDFVKCDSKNAQSFNQLFNKWDPDVFIDNHTSNGADYQYVMTLIATQKEKLGGSYGAYLNDHMLQDLYAKTKVDGYEMIPYVYSRNTPDEGIAGFLDLPRYSSGYAALHGTISFMPETHMLKPYKDRVKSTYVFSKAMIEHIAENKSALLAARKKHFEQIRNQNEMAVNWALDFDNAEEILFKGYEAKYKKSEVTGHSRLWYDRNAPYEKMVPFYNTYKASKVIKKPKAYVIPQGYTRLIERLEWNGVRMEKLQKDTLMDLEMYYITNYETTKSPYEGHYLHSQVETRTEDFKIQVMEGDVLVYTGQKKDAFIIQTLEPESPDSFFAWNFFDGILMQKEHFSSYVFEDLAVEILNDHPELKKAFEEKKSNDVAFAENPKAQLNYIYERSDYHEPTFKRYPIGRLIK